MDLIQISNYQQGQLDLFKHSIRFTQSICADCNMKSWMQKFSNEEDKSS